jgi:hypothetical protein
MACQFLTRISASPATLPGLKVVFGQGKLEADSLERNNKPKVMSEKDSPRAPRAGAQSRYALQGATAPVVRLQLYLSSVFGDFLRSET